MTNMNTLPFPSNKAEALDRGDHETGEVTRLASGNVVLKFTEINQTATQVAREVHAIGYQDMDFVGDNAVTDEGTLPPDIDKARGDNVDYYLSANPEKSDAMTTLRKISIPPQGTLEDLPAFTLSAANLTDDGINALLEAKNVKEIAAMAHTPEASPLMMFELMKHIIQEAYGKDETWFFSIVSSTLKSLEGQFGEKAFRHIGKSVSFEDERISSDIDLVPALFDVDKFYDNVAESVAEETDLRRQRKYIRTLMYFTDSIDEASLSNRVRELRHSITASQQQKSA